MSFGVTVCSATELTLGDLAMQPGETREAAQDLVYVNEDGIQRHVKGIDDKLTVRQKPGPAPGKTMAILGGRHADLLCEVGVIFKPCCLERISFGDLGAGCSF